MAGTYSFDISSQVDEAELENAINNTAREVANRYDFRGTNPEVKLEEQTIKLSASDEYKIKALWDVLQSKAVKRGIDLLFFDPHQPEPGANSTFKQVIKIKKGIDKENAKKITGMIKDKKFKAQAQIQEDQVRVSSKDKDTLQTIMQAVKELELPIPVQFGNYR